MRRVALKVSTLWTWHWSCFQSWTTLTWEENRQEITVAAQRVPIPGHLATERARDREKEREGVRERAATVDGRPLDFDALSPSPFALRLARVLGRRPQTRTQG